MIKLLSLIAILAPLAGSLIAGLFGKTVGRRGAHSVTILGLLIALVAALWLDKLYFLQGASTQTIYLFDWITSGSFAFSIGFLIDHLTVIMMTVVTFVSLLVHIYSIGYMRDDNGYQRFFSYMSLFTFMMLILVMADNFAQLFLGWEGVGLVSYLLIGFWFNKESAAQGSLKAFIVNRVGDFGFLLGIAAVLDYCGSLKYSTVFANAHLLAHQTITIIPGHPWPIATVICILLFIGAMGKSAQIPLHVWLPESMEGPTPISALIHAATMVTAGVFMVARLSPLFELSSTALSLILIVGSTGALFMGLLAIVSNDIKRVIAYSTMSQLGYMMAANGVSAYPAAIFHLMTHACFKALLFLAAGSVIIAMHHEQDMRKMGGLRKYLPVTYITFLIGALALSAVPPFAGFYSKDTIIDAVHVSSVYGHGYAYWCLVLGGLVTAFYIFRAFFMTFHGPERMDSSVKSHLRESPKVVTVPLILLAIPSVLLEGWLIKAMLFSGKQGLIAQNVFISPPHNVLRYLSTQYHGAIALAVHALQTPLFWFAIVGIASAWLFYVGSPGIPAWFKKRFSFLYCVLVKQYGFDWFNNVVFVKGVVKLSQLFYKIGDEKLVDDGMVNGSGRLMMQLSVLAKRLQSGYLYHYALVMVIGLVILMIWKFW